MKYFAYIAVMMMLVATVMAEQVKVEHNFNITVDGEDIDLATTSDTSITGDMHLRANIDNGTQEYKIYSYMDSDDIDGCLGDCPNYDYCNDSLRNISTTMVDFTHLFSGFVNRTEVLKNYTHIDAIVAWEKCRATLELKNEKIHELRCEVGNLSDYEDMYNSCESGLSSSRTSLSTCQNDLKDCESSSTQGYFFGAIIGAAAVYFLTRKNDGKPHEESDFGPLG